MVLNPELKMPAMTQDVYKRQGLVQRSTRIKRIQTTAMLLLFFAAVINYLDYRWAWRIARRAAVNDARAKTVVGHSRHLFTGADC